MRTLRSRINSDLKVSQTRTGVLLYAASALAAEQAEQVVREVLAEYDVTADVRCDRWNPISNSWTSHDSWKQRGFLSRGGGDTSSSVRTARTTHTRHRGFSAGGGAAARAGKFQEDGPRRRLSSRRQDQGWTLAANCSRRAASTWSPASRMAAAAPRQYSTARPGRHIFS